MCNVIPPVIADQLNIETTVKEGWVDASLRRMLSDEEHDITLGVCMPSASIDVPYVADKVTVSGKEVDVFRFLEKTETPWIYDKTLESVFSNILREYKPDVIHIFGTEYPHALACVRACENREKILVGIQGVMSACAKAFCGGLDDNIINASTFRDMIKHDNIAMQQRKFEIRAGFEREILTKVSHVTGRTRFDKEETLKINKNLHYHHMNETLRPEFYDGKWNSESLKDHKIFVSQADYPLKGFHILLDAMPGILEHFPDTVIYVAGNSITGYTTLKEKIKIGTYGKYLLDKMKKYDIVDKVKVTGRLDALKMRDRYENSSVYICTSFIENSPNSLGEAMLCATPSIVPKTGGIPSVASDKEVMFFETGNSNDLADKVISLFSDSTKAGELSDNSRIRARQTHDKDINYSRLMEIYSELCQV